MSVMSAPDVWADQDRLLTVEDMESMPDDEFRYELDDGILIVSPAPSSLHQLAVTRLALLLSSACPAGLTVLAGVGINISRVLGPALAGAIILGLGIAAPFWVDAFSNLGVIAVILWWRSGTRPAHAAFR